MKKCEGFGGTHEADKNIKRNRLEQKRKEKKKREEGTERCRSAMKLTQPSDIMGRKTI